MAQAGSPSLSSGTPEQARHGMRAMTVDLRDPATLAFLDPPPGPALKEANSLLLELGALDSDGRITAEGKSLRALALPPRLARMITNPRFSTL